MTETETEKLDLGDLMEYLIFPEYDGARITVKTSTQPKKCWVENRFVNNGETYFVKGDPYDGSSEKQESSRNLVVVNTMDKRNNISGDNNSANTGTKH